MVGPVYRVIHSMYESVSSIVRQGIDISRVIHQHVGLRQGCILSPCLFSLFISDLPQFLADNGCQGVKLHDEWVRILLYADDGALVASSQADLQCMLNTLKQYCAKWRMFVNVKKTKIMSFSAQTQACPHMFTYDGRPLELVSSFKYLGVMFSNVASKVCYTAAIEHRLVQSKRLVAG